MKRFRIAALAAAPALDGATYYVDASTGNDSRTAIEAQSESTPWRSIAPAANAARAGDTVMVAPGVYREQVAPYASGTASAPIVYRAKDRSNRPVIDGSVVLPANGWRNVSLTNFDAVVRVAVEEGYIKETDEARLLKFRDDPSDESWIGK